MEISAVLSFERTGLEEKFGCHENKIKNLAMKTLFLLIMEIPALIILILTEP